MAKSILSVVTSTDRRGAELFGVDLGRALAGEGRSIDTIALGHGSSRSKLDVPTLGPHPKSFQSLRQLRDRLKASAVLLCHGSRTLMAGALTTPGTGVPFAYRNIGDPTYWSSSTIRRHRVRAFLGRAAAVVAIWPGAAEVLVSRFGVSPNRIRVIPTGVPADRVPLIDDDARASARSQFGLPHDARVLCCIGSLSPEKNVEASIAAAAAADAHLLIAGDGPERARLREIADHRKDAQVHFLGARDPWPVLAASDLMVMSSFSEGIPAVLIEAGMAGLPVVATDVGGVRQIVDDGVTGLLVPPGDREALVDGVQRGLKEHLDGTRAREHCIRHFEIGVVARAWANLIDDLVPAT